MLVAKLSLGALAQGDLWFGGTHPQPLGPASGLERFTRPARLRRRRQGWWVCDRQRDPRQHRLPLPGLWGDRACGPLSAGSAGTAA